MAEHSESPIESVMEKISEKIHAHDSSSSDSDSDSEKKPDSPSSVKAKIFRLFGREKPVHKVFGGGKPADVLLWRNKKISASVLGVATAIWVLFELIEYHLLSLVCHILILSLAILFLWSNAHTFINKTPPRIPQVHLPEEPFLQIASALTFEINRAFVLLHTVPVLYEKYEDKVDPFAEKVMIEIKKQYAVFDAKVLSKIPVGALKAKRV
ncbi:hypothetical protein GH714_038587 [Hevea brasiliensis]|uniref:Reticulon-like protein n=1 Tax=Hevea brasiliensis TaxID=3981 RepID=A0A6A6MNB6_HEVBR|nr:hypothetical protein GH714_038587 [Hevea brasiliensis]